MVVQGVEMSVANAHHQSQRVEDEVVKQLSEKVMAHYHDFFTSGGAMESKFKGRMDEMEALGVRGPGNCQKHLENIAGCGSNFLQCNCRTHAENIWDVIRACIPYGTTRNI